jgi:hypothetical protein
MTLLFHRAMNLAGFCDKLSGACPLCAYQATPISAKGQCLNEGWARQEGVNDGAAMLAV